MTEHFRHKTETVLFSPYHLQCGSAFLQRLFRGPSACLKHVESYLAANSSVRTGIVKQLQQTFSVLTWPIFQTRKQLMALNVFQLTFYRLPAGRKLCNWWKVKCGPDVVEGLLLQLFVEWYLKRSYRQLKEGRINLIGHIVPRDWLIEHVTEGRMKR